MRFWLLFSTDRKKVFYLLVQGVLPLSGPTTKKNLFFYVRLPYAGEGLPIWTMNMNLLPFAHF